MAPIESPFLAVIPTQNPVDTTHTVQEQALPAAGMHRGWGIVRGVIWLAIVVYLLWLGTRLVRAIEKFVDKFQGRAS
jgi:hypothetical protein